MSDAKEGGKMFHFASYPLFLGAELQLVGFLCGCGCSRCRFR